MVVAEVAILVTAQSGPMLESCAKFGIFCIALNVGIELSMLLRCFLKPKPRFLQILNLW